MLKSRIFTFSLSGFFLGLSLSFFLCLFLCSFLCKNSAYAFTDEQSQLLVGHNLDPTTSVLNQGAIDYGAYAISYGLTDYLMISTSPWIDINYNMPNLDLKFGIPIHTSVLRAVSFESIYFKTFAFDQDEYTQESIFERVTGTFHLDAIPAYKLHLTLSLQHFYNHDATYSLRMFPSSELQNCPAKTDGYCETANTWSIGALHEIQLSENFGMFLETAILGFNYLNPYLHGGFSFFYVRNDFLFQLGMSYSTSTAEENTIYVTRDENGTPFYTNFPGGHPHLVHPEIQIQFKI